MDTRRALVGNEEMTAFKPYPSYSQTNLLWLEQIPAHWKVISLRRELRDGNDGIKIGPFGSMLKSDIIRDKGYKVFGQENVIYNDFQIGHRFIDDEKFRELEVYQLFPGDIVITMMGTAGRCQVVPENIQKGIMDSHLIRIRVANDVNPRFVALLIDEAAYIEDQINLNGRGTIMQGLNSSIIKNLSIILPPLDEQNKILTYLDYQTNQIDALIVKKQRLLDLLAEQRAALISQAVTKGLNPDVKMKDSGVVWLGQVPSHWEVKQLKRLTTQITDGTHVTPTYAESGIPFLRVTDIHNSKIDFDEVMRIPENEHRELIKWCNPKKGDLLLSKNGSVGIPKVVDWDEEFSIFVSLCLLKLRPGLNAFYASYFFKSKQIEEQINFGSKKNTVINLHLDKIQSFFFAVPPLEEQKRIVEFLDYQSKRLTNLAAKVETAIERLREYRAALVSSVVTGKVRVDEF